eukprot:CAMPEP_0172454604 /NCGR_PEP_ID=MMETSP1065-20121228/11540_1 /TAXON_ID=265537 /ORGANISM="Amphiprora paludosa, Strain CCMP125" /LENGTH=530 /DNA_ID=CAMNT_0013206955 /DNA_START=47 /DNA_END=1640 /DNA_ORIENTATION=+
MARKLPIAFLRVQFGIVGMSHTQQRHELELAATGSIFTSKFAHLIAEPMPITDAMLLGLVETLEQTKPLPLRHVNLSHNPELTSASLPVVLRLLRVIPHPWVSWNMNGCVNLLEGVTAISLLPLASHLQRGKIVMQQMNLSNCGWSARLLGSWVPSVIGMRPGPRRRLTLVQLGAISLHRQSSSDLWCISIHNLEFVGEFWHELGPTKGLIHTAQLRLSHLYCRAQQFGTSLQQLLVSPQSRALTSLWLQDCDMGLGNLNALGVGIREKLLDNGGLQDLGLVDCNLSTTLLDALATYIPTNDTLKTIDLRNNPFESSFDGLASILQSCRGLQSLSVSGNSDNLSLTCTTEQVEPFLLQLQLHSSLEKLEMISGRCTPAVMKAICQSLQPMRHLIFLDLQSVHTVINMTVLAETLPGMAGLRRLALYDGRVGDRLASSVDHYSAHSPSHESNTLRLAEAIAPLQHLVRLDFSSHKVVPRPVQRILWRNAAHKCAISDVPMHRMSRILAQLGANAEDPNPVYTCLSSKCDFF